MAPFWGILSRYSPKYCSILLKFWPEVVSIKINTVFEKSFKVLNFSLNETHPNFTVFVHLGGPIYRWKLKILQKIKIFAKTASFGISNNISPRSQKNKRMLVKSTKKKNTFGAKLVLIAPYDRGKWLSEILAYSIMGPFLQFLVSLFLLFSTLPRRNNTLFLVQDSIGSISFFFFFLRGGGRDYEAITPVNNVKLSWKFDHR